MSTPTNMSSVWVSNVCDTVIDLILNLEQSSCSTISVLPCIIAYNL